MTCTNSQYSKVDLGRFRVYDTRTWMTTCNGWGITTAWPSRTGMRWRQTRYLLCICIGLAPGSIRIIIRIRLYLLSFFLESASMNMDGQNTMKTKKSLRKIKAYKSILLRLPFVLPIMQSTHLKSAMSLSQFIWSVKDRYGINCKDKSQCFRKEMKIKLSKEN